jgi:hypothetical protein
MTDLIVVILNPTYTILQTWRVGGAALCPGPESQGALVSGSPNLSINIFNFVNISYYFQ